MATLSARQSIARRGRLSVAAVRAVDGHDANSVSWLHCRTYPSESTAGSGWLLYFLSLVLFASTTYQRVLIDARGPQDAGSDRDDAAEIATSGFLHRHNPWEQRTQIGNVITTGPGTLLLAAPFVAVTHHIDWLTFAFWMFFAAVLLIEDIRQRNQTWLPLCLLYFAGVFLIETAQHWSLEELSYGCVFIVLATWAARRGAAACMGAALAFAFLIRANYAFVAFGVVLWWWLEEGASWRALARAALGGATTLLATGIVFRLVVGPSLWLTGPLGPALSKSASPWPDANSLYHLLQVTLGHAPGQLALPLRSSVALGVILLVALLMRRAGRSGHPYWHAAAGQAAAFFVVAPVDLRWARDYILPLVILGFLGVAASPNPAAPGRERAS